MEALKASELSTTDTVADDYAAMRARACGTNVNDKSLLATDYLNHFNEIIMMIELVPDAPECLEDCRQWQPLGYIEHFAKSSIADRDLAIEAYGVSPAQYRIPFETLIADMDRLVLGAIDRLGAVIATAEESQARRIAETSSGMLRNMVDKASAIIHGETRALHQSEIDDLMQSW